ncbi:hypothetical protein GCM10023321_68750 [Pseudonocardia eucalypti]|uniref:3D-(3,5/4)-trihydroxycyclohexane-1,2-dione acylhydrolase (Decyclizing) n=1 Tax=Pseudonocardia eucalypti TaxID=648755 RepID=A0ABP9R2J2_9PSEU|nr:3D-(3,5/4)-trihydroxycyclohexane-1,2-dione acylhydrolase (decyclizing) [Pseudonocardia eucalypti]
MKLTVAQAAVRFLAAQYSERDGLEHRLIPAMFGIFGHGNVAGLAQALLESSASRHPEHTAAGSGDLPYYLARNEQGMVHTAVGYAKTRNRLATLACTASIGPGSTNMVTGAALATINRIPVLLLPSDFFATRVANPVLQELEDPRGYDVSVNDAFRPVSRFFDRVNRPEQLPAALLGAMRVLTDPADTGAVTLALPQDVQAEAFDWPEELFARRVWHIPRPVPEPAALARAVALLRSARRPLVIAGGGVVYSEAGSALRRFTEATGIPVADTQAGKGAIPWDHSLSVGGIGATGSPLANELAREADVVLGIGTRYSDFTTASRTVFANPGVRFVNLNVARFDAAKHAGEILVADAREGLTALTETLAGTARAGRAPAGNAAALAGNAATAQVGTAAAVLADNAAAARADNAAALADTAAADHAAAAPAGTAAAALHTANAPLGVPEIPTHRTQIPDSPYPESRLAGRPGEKPGQAEVLGVLNAALEPSDVVVQAAGSMPGDLQRMWRASDPKAYHVEYGYSCMGYEIAGALGVKLAAPEREVFALVGDGSYLMMAQEIVTAVAENIKLNIVIVQNHGFASIGALSESVGSQRFGTAYRYRDANTGRLDGERLPVDLAANAASLGADVIRVSTIDEFRAAIARSRAATRTTAIHIETDPLAPSPGSNAWWDVPVAEVSDLESTRQARKTYEEQKTAQRPLY